MKNLRARKVEFPLILVNLKTYKEAMGDMAVKFATIADRVSKRSDVCIAISPQIVDLRRVVDATEMPVFAQHVDPVGYGKFTGHVPPEAVIDAGGDGTLVNHSERQINLDTVKATVERIREVDLMSIVCVDTPEKGEIVANYKPEAIAIEPPELIGTGIPVSRVNPKIISDSVSAVKKIDSGIKVLCGAGITTGEDVKAALKLGAEGILVASGVVKAENTYNVLLELTEAMQF